MDCLGLPFPCKKALIFGQWYQGVPQCAKNTAEFNVQCILLDLSRKIVEMAREKTFSEKEASLEMLVY